MMGFTIQLFLALCALLSGVLAAPAAAAAALSGAAMTPALPSTSAVLPAGPVLPEVSILPIDPIEPVGPITAPPPDVTPPPPWWPIECDPELLGVQMPESCKVATLATESEGILEATTPITPSPESSSPPLPTSPAPVPTSYDWTTKPDWAAGLSDEEWDRLRARLSPILEGPPVKTANGTGWAHGHATAGLVSGTQTGLFGLAAPTPALAERDDACAPTCGPKMAAAGS